MEKSDIIRAIAKHLEQSLTPFADWPSFLQSGARNAFLSDASGAVLALDLHLENATALDLSSFALPALRWLNVSDSKNLQTLALPASLPELVHLDASQCALTEIEIPADAFGRQFFGESPQPPRSVPSLYLQKNQLRSVSFKGKCPGLELLDLSNNQLDNLHITAGFARLKYLYLNDNQMENLLLSNDLPELIVLNVRTNKLKELPEVKSSTGIFAKLETLYVQENPLKYEETLIQGDESGNALEIIGLLRAAAKSGSRPNYRAKLIVVGNGRIGKTCLVNRLLGKSCPDDQIYTHGISIQHLFKKHLPDVKTPELDLQVWDFGGQDVYFATHQFFLSEEASYIYVWTDKTIARNNREKDKHRSPAMYDDKWQKHDYWLENIRMHGLKSPVLIVKTHCLEPDSKEVLPFDDLRKRYELTNAPLEFEAKSNDTRYLERLKVELTKIVNELPLLGSDIPVSYDEVIATIRRRKEHGDEELSKLDFFKLAEPFKIAENELDSLLGYLKKTGEIIYFPENDKLKERIFIDPQALIQKVYKLLENNEYLKTHEGNFTRQYAKETLGWVDWEVLMELLISFELVYEKKSVKTYIAPQYLPKLPESGNERNTFEGHKKEKKRRFTLRYPRFLPDNVMINVLSKYGPYSLEAAYRNGIYFMKEGAGETCLIECDEADQSIRVFTNENEAADRVAKDVFDQFIGLSKKANVHLTIDEKDWVDARVAREAFDKNKDIPLINQEEGWVEDKSALAFLFGERNLESISHKATSMEGKSSPDRKEPFIQPKPAYTMSTSTKNLLIGGIIVIIILLLPIWKDGTGGKISLLGLLSVEINGAKGASGSTEKVSVIGRISINNRQASREQIREVSVKNNSRVDPQSLSGDRFELKEVEIPTDKRVDIEFVFLDGYKDSRVFNVSEIKDGICDIGEIRIFIEKRPPKKGTGGSASPNITINNTNIIQNQVQNPDQ